MQLADIFKYNYIKFIYSEKATKLCEIFTLLFFRWIELRIVIWHIFWESGAKLKNFLRLIHLYENCNNLTLCRVEYATPFTVHKRWVIVCRSFHVRGPHILQWIPVRTTCIDTYIQGRTKWGNYRLTTKNPDYYTNLVGSVWLSAGS